MRSIRAFFFITSVLISCTNHQDLMPELKSHQPKPTNGLSLSKTWVYSEFTNPVPRPYHNYGSPYRRILYINKDSSFRFVIDNSVYKYKTNGRWVFKNNLLELNSHPAYKESKVQIPSCQLPQPFNPDSVSMYLERRRFVLEGDTLFELSDAGIRTGYRYNQVKSSPDWIDETSKK